MHRGRSRALRKSRERVIKSIKVVVMTVVVVVLYQCASVVGVCVYIYVGW